MTEKLLNENIISEEVEQRYYYKDSNNNYYSYKEEHNDLIEITEQEWNEHLSRIMPQSIQYTAEQIQAQNRIRQLKQLLSDTDYQAIKYAEGMLSAEEYASMKAQRQAWRDEINRLEKEI